MNQYLSLLRDVLENGEYQPNRTGIATYSVFGRSFRHNLQDGQSFPLLTTKFVSFKTVLHELLFFLSGTNDIRYLWKNGVKIWDGNYFSPAWKDNPAYKEYSLGYIYGLAWRDFEGVDQITDLIQSIQNNPFSRRHFVSAWRPSHIDKAALPPCHVSFQLHVHNDKSLSLSMLMRSCDLFLGLPFNIASYATLLLMICRVTDYQARDLIIQLNNVHIYENHLEQVREQLQRKTWDLPSLLVNTRSLLSDYSLEDFSLQNYRYHKKLKAVMAV